MTAMNAFARSDAAHIIADTGCYSVMGDIVEFHRKVSQSTELRFMIGQSGSPGADCGSNIDHWLQSRPSQQAVIDGIGSLLRDLEADAEDGREAAAKCDARARARGVPAEYFEPPAPVGIRLTLAWWDLNEGRGRVALIGSVDGMCGKKSDAFSLRHIGTIFTPGLPFDRWPDHTFEPATDRKELAKIQRAVADENGIYRVGGSLDHYRVDQGGIVRTVIKKWRDPIGEPIKLSRSWLQCR